MFISFDRTPELQIRKIVKNRQKSSKIVEITIFGGCVQFPIQLRKTSGRPALTLATFAMFFHNFTCSIFQIHSKMDLEIPRTRFRRLYKNISDPGDSEFLGRRNRNQKVTLGRRLAQNDARNAKVRTKSHFRPRIDLTSQYFFAISKVQIFKTMPKSRSVASWLPIELNAPRTLRFMIF